jgi:hypothetical protein
VLAYAVGALTYVKVARPGPGAERWFVLFGLAALVAWLLAVGRAALAPRPRHHGALALDRERNLADRITTALSFSEMPGEQRTPLMELAIEDAIARAEKLRPRRAAPLHVPRELPVALLLVAALVGISFLEVRSIKPIPAQRRIEPLAMTADDVELLRETAAELQEKSQDPDTLAAVRRFNQLIEDIAQRRLDRREVFQRLEELERQLAKSAEAERQSLEEGLKSVARELEKSDLAKPVAQPLEEKRLADAEQALRKLAERLKKKEDPPSKAQLEKLRKALEEASKQSSERLKQLEQRRQEVSEQRKRLLKKKDEGKLTQQEQKELAKQDRQLERLERDVKQAKQGKQQLSKLDKELADAARKLMDEMGQSAENLQQGAEDINRMSREQTSDQEKREMLRKIQEMREMIRQQGKAGQQRIQRLMRFSQRARGQSGDGKGQEGKQGQQQGQGQQGQGQQGQGKPGQGLQPGMTLGPDGKPIPVAGAGQGAGDMPGGQQPGQGGDKPGAGSGQGGEKWGSGHDENLKGEASKLKGETKDVSAAAVDTGQGSASSEVIYGAAQRGFRGRGYKNVYTEYREVAEEVIEKDQIPPGYRFYVQRYFQLIRPRE